MFLAAAAFGLLFYLTQRGIAKMLMLTPASLPAAFISLIGVLVWIVEAVLIFLVARWVVDGLLYGAPPYSDIPPGFHVVPSTP
jgi:hypothetical protein